MYCATSPFDAARHAQFVLSIVPEGKHVEEVYLNPTTGILANLDSTPTGSPALSDQPTIPIPSDLSVSKNLSVDPFLARKIFIDSSTIDIATSLHVAEVVKTRSGGQADFYDAPVSGGVRGAQERNITFMVGGREDEDERADLGINAEEESSRMRVVKEVLSRMGRNVICCGGLGMGLSCKLAKYVFRHSCPV